MSEGSFQLSVKLASPCHPYHYLLPDRTSQRHNELRCSHCKRRWLIGVVVPLDELVLYSTEEEDLPPAPPLPGE